MHALRRFIRSGHTENLREDFSKKKKKKKGKGILITQTSYTYLLPTHSQSFSTYTVFTTTLPYVFPDARGFQSS